MGKKYRSPAKLSRSLLRCLEYKENQLLDMWNTDISINLEYKDIIWNVTKSLKPTLKKDVKIIDAWHPEFPALRLSSKLTQFQNMWMTDASSFRLFNRLHSHFRSNSTQCDNFCTLFTSPFCTCALPCNQQLARLNTRLSSFISKGFAL